MHSRRLIQKFEALTDDAQAFFEGQLDLFLTMPEYRRARSPLHLVPKAPSAQRAIAASQQALRDLAQARTQLSATTQIHVRTVASLQTTLNRFASKPTTARVAAPRRLLARSKA